MNPCSLVVYSAMALHAALAPAPPGKVICLGNGHYGKLELSAEKRAPGVTVRAAQSRAGDDRRRRAQRLQPQAGPLRDRRRSRDRAGLAQDLGPAQPHQRRLLRGRSGPDHEHQHLRHDDPRQPLRRPLRRGRDPPQPLPRQRRPRSLRGPDRRQRDHRRARERQPQRLPAIGLGRRRPLLPPQLPARQPLPGLLHQGPAGAGRPRRPRRQPDAAQRRSLRAGGQLLRAARDRPDRRADPRRRLRSEHDLDPGQRHPGRASRRALRPGHRSPTTCSSASGATGRGRSPPSSSAATSSASGKGPCRACGAARRTSCKPSFLDPAVDDYRLAGGIGIDWAPRDQHYGP